MTKKKEENETIPLYERLLSSTFGINFFFKIIISGAFIESLGNDYL